MSWNPPNSGWLKLNTDGSSLGNPGDSSYGGLIRNEYGDWVCGYAGKIGHETSLAAEVWGITMGLRLIKSMNLNNVIIETDCQAAILLITVKNVDESHPLSWLINSCRMDMRDLRCFMVHVKRNGNRCADEMAKIGRRQQDRFDTYDNPPSKLIRLLKEDAKNVTTHNHQEDAVRSIIPSVEPRGWFFDNHFRMFGYLECGEQLLYPESSFWLEEIETFGFI